MLGRDFEVCWKKMARKPKGLDMEKNLYLVRHAECERNLNRNLVSGRSSSSPLTAIGKVQSFEIGEALKYIRFDCILASTAVRATDTAIIAMNQSRYCDGDEIIFDENLEELDQGDWEGRVRSEVYNEDVMKQIAREGANFRPPNGESQAMAANRFDYATYKHIEANRNIIVFSHGTVIKCYLKKILGYNQSVMFNSLLLNTSVTRLVKRGEDWGGDLL
jgi:broad specificity phosphatase PhoE